VHQWVGENGIPETKKDGILRKEGWGIWFGRIMVGTGTV